MTYPRLNNTLAVTALLALVACGTSPANTKQALLYAPTTVQHFSSVRDVQISAADSVVSIAAQYGATVIGWYPDTGYATIGLTTGETLDLMGASAPKNYKAPSTDNPKAYGLNAWSSGWSSWGGGWQSWGGGWTSWGTGSDSSKMPGQNAQIWQKIGLPAATRLAPKAGLGVTVAVIDTGIDLQHPAFQGALSDPSTWWDWVSGDAKPQDESGGSSYGHGTCVAGIALQVAPKIKIMPLRVLGADGMGETANVIAAINWAVAKGAKIINLSLGTTKDKGLEQAISNATKNGVFVVASTGNSGDENVTYPASDSMRGGDFGKLSVGVGSSDLSDRKSRFSTYGKNKVEMVAIGENVSSPAPGAKMGAWSGTSMAAPMVTGALALALGQPLKITKSELMEKMRVTASDIYNNGMNEGYKDMLGKGRLNIEQFLADSVSQ